MSKNIFLASAFLLLFSMPAIAQEHTWMIYGSGEYDNVSYNNYSSPPVEEPLTVVGWNVNVGVGYEFSKHFMVGIQGGRGEQDGVNLYNYLAPTSSGYYQLLSEEKYTDVSWQAGLFCRFTEWLGKRFYVYGQLFAGKYGVNETSKVINAGNTNVVAMPYYYTSPEMPDGDGFVINLFPAIGVNVIQGFGVHMDIGGISYTTYNATGNTLNGFIASDRHRFNVTLGQQFSFGIHKIIGWKKFNPKKIEEIKG